MDQPPRSSSLLSPLFPVSPLMGFTDKMQALVNTGVTFNPRSMPYCLPPPKLSTFCTTNLADNEDDKRQEQLSPAWVDKTAKYTKVTKRLLHQSPLIQNGQRMYVK